MPIPDEQPPGASLIATQQIHSPSTPNQPSDTEFEPTKILVLPAPRTMSTIEKLGIIASAVILALVVGLAITAIWSSISSVILFPGNIMKMVFVTHLATTLQVVMLSMIFWLFYEQTRLRKRIKILKRRLTAEPGRVYQDWAVKREKRRMEMEERKKKGLKIVIGSSNVGEAPLPAGRELAVFRVGKVRGG